MALLQDDARVTNAALARTLGLSPPGLQKRVRKLEQQGIIRQYVALLSREALGLDLLCFVNVSLAHHQPDLRRRFRDAMRRMPEVLECHFLTGEVDYVVKASSRSATTMMDAPASWMSAHGNPGATDAVRIPGCVSNA